MAFSILFYRFPTPSKQEILLQKDCLFLIPSKKQKEAFFAAGGENGKWHKRGKNIFYIMRIIITFFKYTYMSNEYIYLHLGNGGL